MIDLKAQISHEGIDLIRDTIIRVFARGQNGKGLDPVEQVQVDLSTLIDGLNDAGCEVPNDKHVRDVERACWMLIISIGRSNHGWAGHSLVEALNVTRENLSRQAVDRRLQNCQKLMHYINGYDCYSRKVDGIHSFDASMNEALKKMKILFENNKAAETTVEGGPRFAA